MNFAWQLRLMGTTSGHIHGWRSEELGVFGFSDWQASHGEGRSCARVRSGGHVLHE
jgi:hypothetical protein